MEFDQRGHGLSWRWSLLISVVFLNICLPSLVLAYGVIIVSLAELQVPIWVGLYAPAVYILTYSLSQCWFREAADSWGGSIGYRVMGAIGLSMVVIGLLASVGLPYNLQPYVYGILGGLGSSLLSAQVDAVVFDTYDSRLGLIRGLCFAAQAVGQALFPHIITEIIDFYGYSFSYIILGGIVLQSMPAIMLLKVDENIRRPISFSRYSDLAQTYAIFSNEGMDKSHYTTELQLHDMSRKCWKSPSDDNLHSENEEHETDEYEGEVNATITPPPSPEEKRRNIFGVEILPEIPEESETSDEESAVGNENSKNKKRLSVAIKRLSTLGDNLDGYISKQIRRGSQNAHENESKEYSEIEVSYDNVSPVTDVQREKIFNSFSFRCQSAYASMRRRLWMPSYRIYTIRRRFIYFAYSINDTFIKPLTRSLSCWRFYPSLMLYFARLGLTAVMVVSLPILASKMHPKISVTDSNFLMTLHGFTWICFLLSTPWLVQMPKRNFKYVTMVGLAICSAGCFVLSQAENHDFLSIGCVVAGFGYGAITSCCETTVQDFLGARKWPKLQSTLETTSGILLAIFIVGISYIVDKEGGLQYAIFILALIVSIIAIVWLVMTIVSFYIIKVRSRRLGRRWVF